MSMSPEPEEESAASVLHRPRARVGSHSSSREAARAHGTLVTTTRASARSAKNLFDRDAMAHNLNAVDGCRSYLTLFGAVGAGVVGATGCVEINQCVGCDLARSSGEEPASPRHRAGVASMAWRTTR